MYEKGVKMTKTYSAIIKKCKIARKRDRFAERACIIGAIESLENIPICPDKMVNKSINKTIEKLHKYKFEKAGGIGGELE